MSNQLANFDPDSIMDSVRARIRSTVVDLIPDDEWDKLIKDEVDDFFTEKRSYGYGDSKGTSSFQKVVHAELEVVCKEKVKEYLANFNNEYWADGSVKPSDELRKIIEENAAKIFSSLMGSMIQRAISEARFQ